MIIRKTDGSHFSLKEIHFFQVGVDSLDLVVEGYLGGIKQGENIYSVVPAAPAYVKQPYADTPTAFSNIDEVRITGKNYTGAPEYDYVLDTGTLVFNSITVEDPIIPNTTPTFVGSTTLTVAKNAAATDIKPLLHVSDSDSGQTLTWTQSAAPSHGSLSISSATAASGGADIAPGGTITYTPTTDYVGSDSFTIQVSDGIATATRTISVTVKSTDASLTSVAGQSDSTPGTQSGVDASRAITWEINVENAKSALALADIAAAAGAATQLYSDVGFATEITGDNTLTLTEDSATIAYIKVTSGAGTTVKYYAVTITRAAAPVLSVNTRLTVTEGAGATITNTLLKTTDSDTAATSITYTIEIAPPHGTLKNSGIPLSAGGSFTQDDIDKGRITYTNDGGETSADSFTFTVSDGTNTLSPQTFFITITSVNDAPVIAAPPSITVTEDYAKALTGISFSDADAGSGAITATFSVPSGTLSAISGGGVTVDGTASALTLTGTLSDINTFITNSQLSYTTALNANGDVALTVSVNDNGYTGGGGAQTTSTTIQLNITPVNDAPTLSGGPYVWASTNEDTTSAGALVSTILSAVNGQDVDGDPLGIALTASPGSGTWQYSTDGSTWAGVGTVSNSAALLLSSSTQLRYVPDGKNGETATLTFRIWDQTSGTASTNGTKNTADTSTNGWSTAFSTGTAQANLTVTPVNDAPVLNPLSPTLSGLTASQITNVGQTVASFIGTSISDVDSGAAEGIAVYLTNNGGGTWQFSIDSGANWQDVGTVSQASALLLRDTDRVRFVPNGPDAKTASIAYYAWDRTSGTQGNKVDVTANGGTTSFSAATDTAGITVAPDASVISVASTAANGIYKVGEEIVITVGFNKAVTVTGTPRLALKLGATDRTVDYSSGSGTNTLSFSYIVQPGDACSDLDYASTGALSINDSASIQADGANVSLILPTPSSAGSLGDNKDIVIDGVAPTANITVTNTALKAGDTSTVTITFSEAVTGLTSANLIAANGTLSNISPWDGGITWTAIFTPAASIEDASNVITLYNTGVRDAAGNAGIGTTESGNYAIDTRSPAVTSVAVPGNGNYMAGAKLTFVVTFDESVTVTGTPHISLNIGGETVYADYSEGSGSAALTFTYTIGAGLIDTDGISLGTLSLNSGTIKDAAGNAANLVLNHVGSTASVLVDTTAPVSGGAGTITTSELASSSVKVTWTAATDNMTAAVNLQYKVVYSLSNNIDTLTKAETNGTAFGGWSTSITSATVTGLTASTGYYFNVIVKDSAGNKATYTSVTATTAGAPSGGGGNTPTGSAVVEVNGEKQDAGTTNTQTTGSQTVTTITVDDTKLNKILESKGQNATVTLPTSGNSDVTVGELNGQTVKNMEAKEATLEIKTGTVTYTLPASQINIDAVSTQLGSQVELKDIKVSVKIAEPSADTVKIVENAASKGGYQLIVKPVEFEITCKSGDKTIEISKFNGYVERTVAIPDGVDPSKITTGIVLNSDGTFRHVPTQIIKIDGKYYAKINSLTNSTYSVIWNPVEFSDVLNHWSKGAVNDMGSRMVVTGIGNNIYEPDRSITRAEFAAIAVRALGLAQGTAESSFGDVSLSDWFNGYVDTASAYALITGYDSTTYGPSDMITREQAMAIIARAMKLAGLTITLTDYEESALLSKYTDSAKISDYAKESAAVCLKAGIVAGKTASTISPKDYVTRAEVAVMVQRLLQKCGLI